MITDRTGEVWWGSHANGSARARVYLIIRTVDRHEHVVLDLETGETTDFLTKGIEQDENWRRL